MSSVGGVARTGRLPRSARRKQLLAAAQQVFVAKGYHAAGMDDIADKAGVSKPVLYQHFPGKRDLYLALIEVQAEALTEKITTSLTGTVDNRQRIHRVLSAFFDFVDGADRGDAGAYRLIFESDLANDPLVRDRVDEVTRATTRAVADVVATDTGLTREAAELLASALTGAAQIASRWWLSSEAPMPRTDAVALLEALFWRGVSNFPRQAD